MLAARKTDKLEMDRLSLTGQEQHFAADDIIVSKTDPKGILTYVNEVFVEISGYVEAELIGRPHSLIRHPHMPRCVFRLLWDTISSGNEIFAYVNNRCKNGDHYWVLAHVTPTFGPNNHLVGYHSNRRVPSAAALEVIKPLYRALYEEEQKQGNGRATLDAGRELLESTIKKTGKSYDQFILSL